MLHCYDKLELYSLYNQNELLRKNILSICVAGRLFVKTDCLHQGKVISILFIFLLIPLLFLEDYFTFCPLLFAFPYRAKLYFWCSAFAPSKSNNWIWSYSKWPLSKKDRINIYRFLDYVGGTILDQRKAKPKKTPPQTLKQQFMINSGLEFLLAS